MTVADTKLQRVDALACFALQIDINILLFTTHYSNETFIFVWLLYKPHIKNYKGYTRLQL